ncbi:MAG: metal dependent phosphohydrolase [Ignavibacteria bacterium]|nr:metal dependent phosphohydrolase [Ignavibacteria bacterium]
MNEKIDIARVIEKIDELPTLPTIYSSLLDAMSNPRSTVTDIAKIIEKDISSATKVLKAVNSSVYGLSVKVTSISQAIFHLGFNEVKNLVITLSLINMFDKVKGSNVFNLVDFWKHSIAVGIISRQLGLILGIRQLEDFFLSGVIHDVGKLFFLKNFYEQYLKTVDFVNDSDISLRDAEAKIFGANHGIVGEMLAIKWKFPDTIKNAIKSHNNGMVGDTIDVLAGCVHLGNIMAHIMNLGFSGDPEVQQPNIEIWKTLKFSPGTFTKMMPKILTDYNQSTAILLVK